MVVQATTTVILSAPAFITPIYAGLYEELSVGES
jgi:hypothetical protein